MNSSETGATEKVLGHIEEKAVPLKSEENTRAKIASSIAQEAYERPGNRWCMDDFELHKQIGRCKYGQVYMGCESDTVCGVIIKILSKENMEKDKMERMILSEIGILSHLKHPNILELFTWFSDDFRIFVVYDRINCWTIGNYLKSSPDGNFNEHLSAKYTYQVADALNYCHKHGVIYSDIKSENLMLTHHLDIKLADFDCSGHDSSEKMCATPVYFSSEKVEQQIYTAFVHQWCLGILCYEFLSGYTPFESNSSEEIHEKIHIVQLKFASHLSEGAIDLIKKLLTCDDSKVLSLEQVMTHSWIVVNK